MANLNFNKINLDNVPNDKNHNYSPTKPFNGHCNTNKLIIYHQNIRGISNKTEELLTSLSCSTPQIICLSEHHLQPEEIGLVSLNKYILGASFCRQTYKHGGVCIYVLNNIPFNTINLEVYPKEKDLEICALKLSVTNNSFAIICIYKGDSI